MIILKILLFLLIFITISCGVPIIPAMLGLGSYWLWVLGISASQIAVFMYVRTFFGVKKVQETISRYDDAILESLEKYNNLKTKKYFQTFGCQSCSKNNIVEIDLDGNLEFACAHCGVRHAIYVNMSTAVITTPIVSSN